MKRHINRTSLFSLVLLLTATVAARADKVDGYVKAERQKATAWRPHCLLRSVGRAEM